MITSPFSVLNILEILFSSTVIEWNNFDLTRRNSETFSIFKKSIFKFIQPSSNSIFSCHNPNGMKLSARYGWVLITSMSKSLGTIFRIPLIQFADVEMTSRLLFVTYFIVQIIYTRNIVVHAVNFFDQILAG